VRDSSAGAIASSGLLDLSDLSGKEEFRDAAINILSRFAIIIYVKKMNEVKDRNGTERVEREKL